ncbi:MAG: adenylosuccinate synthetase [Malacoplasma sp.]|nr:adenylosuccinate synthetase [Malacoplasma sp.]
MNLNKIIYKINNENFKKFQVFNSPNTLNFFIISDFSKISTDEIIRLLNNDRKIIVDDNAIISVEKVMQILSGLQSESKKANLFISKEAYLKCWFHQKFSDLLSELEITNTNNPDLIVKSDIPLQIGIKLKYFDNPDYLLKVLDGTLYIKKIFLEKFENFKFDLKLEFERLLTFGRAIKDNLITSANIFVENQAKNYNVVCNVLDLDNNFYPEIDGIEKWGILSCVDLDNSIVAYLNEQEISNLPYFLKYNGRSFGWIDAVKIKRNIQKQNIKKIILENIEWLDNFEELKICTEYGFNFMRTKTLPQINKVDKTSALYTKFDGWNKDTKNLLFAEEVPCEMLYFIHELKRILGVEEISLKLQNLEIKV